MSRSATRRRTGLIAFFTALLLGTSPAHIPMVVRFDGSSGARVSIEPPAELKDVVVWRIDPASGESLQEVWRITGLGTVGQITYGDAPAGFAGSTAAPLHPGGLYEVGLWTSDAEISRTSRWNAVLYFVVTQGGLFIPCGGVDSAVDEPRCHPFHQLMQQLYPPVARPPLGLPAPLEGK